MGLEFFDRETLAGQEDSAFLAIVHELVVGFDKKLCHFLLVVETCILLILSFLNYGFSFSGSDTVVNHIAIIDFSEPQGRQ